MAVEMATCSAKSLFEKAVEAVVLSADSYIDDLEGMPSNIKARLLKLMSKRGLLTDNNIGKMLFSGLQVLDLSDCEVSDLALQQLGRCPSLAKIDLNAARDNRTSISTHGVQQVAQSCPRLQVVYLRRCTELGDEAVISLAQNCPLLRELNVGGCRHLTDRALQALGAHSSRLQNLNFGQTQVTDAGVLALVSGKPGPCLKEVHMVGCRELTDEAVEAVIQYCPKINILLFHNCPRMTDQARVALEEVVIGRQSKMRQVTWTIY